MTTLSELADRLEQAGPEDQAGLLREVFVAVFPKPESYLQACSRPNETDEYLLSLAERIKDRVTMWHRFVAMLDCGAYLSAAKMLMPAGMTFYVDTGTSIGVSDCHACVWNVENRLQQGGCKSASTDSYALAAACCRAVAGKETP